MYKEEQRGRNQQRLPSIPLFRGKWNGGKSARRPKRGEKGRQGGKEEKDTPIDGHLVLSENGPRLRISFILVLVKTCKNVRVGIRRC
ncbi:hypothetical protein KM043_014556 [Ampulex compressa]|nr:hypothetical protein KM043_014556 [Ampulex compressa]